MSEQELSLGGAITAVEEMRKERSRFQYEKVFWNTAFGIGLVGVTWVAVKLGLMMEWITNPEAVIDDVVASITDPVTKTVVRSQMAFIVKWVEGEYKNRLPPQGNTGIIVIYFRDLYVNNPDEYYRRVYQTTTSGIPVNGDEPLVEDDVVPRDPMYRMLGVADRVYGRYAPVLPLGLVVLNVGNEMVRVRRLKAI
jgi:hypothetical protein